MRDRDGRVTTAEVEPDLAESWTISPDGTRWTFKLRRGEIVDPHTIQITLNAYDPVFPLRMGELSADRRGPLVRRPRGCSPRRHSPSRRRPVVVAVLPFERDPRPRQRGTRGRTSPTTRRSTTCSPSAGRSGSEKRASHYHEAQRRIMRDAVCLPISEVPNEWARNGKRVSTPFDPEYGEDQLRQWRRVCATRQEAKPSR